MKKVLQAVVEAGQFEVARALVLASTREFRDKGHVDENERPRGGRVSMVDDQGVRDVQEGDISTFPSSIIFSFLITVYAFCFSKKWVQSHDSCLTTRCMLYTV